LEKEMSMKKILFVLVLVAAFLVSCSMGPPIQRKSPVKLPRSSPETTPRELVTIITLPAIGTAEVDLVTNQLVLTTLRKGRGGMRARLFGNYTRVLFPEYVYEVVKVPLEDFKIYVLTMTADDYVRMVTFQLKEGMLHIR
jgi:hypothetical protein